MISRRDFLAGLAGGALLGERAFAASAPPSVVASFSILADITRNVAGDTAAVTPIVGSGMDAHTFDATPAAARQLAGAALVIVNGLHFEGWLPRLVRASGYRGRVTVASDGIAPRMRGRAVDPHAWQSLVLAQAYVENIRQALVALPQADAAAITRRAQAYTARLAELDGQARAAFAAIPATRRRVLTTHDAFGYLGDAYGITFVAARGWSTQGEPSAATVARLIQDLREQRIRAVFLEKVGNERLVRQVARDAGATVGGTLYADALSRPGGEADTYLRLYAHNVGTLVAALR